MTLGNLAARLSTALLGRANPARPGPAPVPLAEPVHVDLPAVAERLAGAIRFRTVSHQDPTETPAQSLLGLHRYLEAAFPRIHAALTREVVGDYSLLYTWPGTDRASRPILLMAHLDVVPADAEGSNLWTYPPFAGRIADGYIWGRGAMDDKSGVLGSLEAVEALLAEGFQPRRTVYLAFGHDEELAGQAGAAQIAALLAGRGVRLEYVLDEGLFITHALVPGVSRPVALIGIGEKGYFSVEFTALGAGGHSSAPPPQTAIGILCAAIQRLEARQMPACLDGPARQMFQALNPELPLIQRAVLASTCLFGRLLERRLAAQPATNALIRTTAAATLFQAGLKDNVLPERATAVVNFRIRPGDRVGDVLNHIRRVVADRRVAIRPLVETASEPPPISSTNSPGFDSLARAIRQVFPDALVAPSLLTARTDSRYFAPLADAIYRFRPQRLGPDDIQRFHGVDERISVDGYGRLVQFYALLLRGSVHQ